MPGRDGGERWLARLERWPRYVAGMLTETTYILGLMIVALLVAVLAFALWR
jgi:tetrahydromethanopterin S-methyltransferase subunit B